jgi:hypothetical protein
MRIAHIWSSPQRRQLVQQIICQERPEWTLTALAEKNVATLPLVIETLKRGYEAILLPMSIQHALAVKMAELAHRTASKTKIVLFSQTGADPTAIAGLFDGFIVPSKDIANLCELIEKFVSTDRFPLREAELSNKILKTINSSGSIRSALLMACGLRRKEGDFSLDEYGRAVDASISGDLAATPDAYDIFVSYSSKDASLAKEIVGLCKKCKLSCFLAEHSIEVGANWQNALRDALIASREIVVIISENSLDSSWVILEIGAAWALGKRINTCLVCLHMDALPGILKGIQVRQLATQPEKQALANELAHRLLGQ